MPETSLTLRRRSAIAAAVALVVLTGVPAALAQTPPPQVSDPQQWSSSEFGSPFAGGAARMSTESFPIRGIFQKQTTNAAERIVSVRVTFSRSAGAAPDPTDGCVPDQPPAFVQEGIYSEGVARYPFIVGSEISVWPCNGRYQVTAEAQSNQEPGPYAISAQLTVAAPPVPVRVISASADEEAMVVTVNWEPLAEADLDVDAVGYRVERAGPAQPDGSYGEFVQLGSDLGVDTVPSYRDTLESGGDYRYRVRSLRDGPDGLVPAPASTTAVAEASLPGGPTETTTTTTTTTEATTASGGGRGGTPATVPRTSPASRPSGPPTTADTGFDEELDYSGVELGDEEPGELAAEGQSIIRTPGEGAGLLAPVAGALVLLGWAGHVIYLNRLAKQF